MAQFPPFQPFNLVGVNSTGYSYVFTPGGSQGQGVTTISVTAYSGDYWVQIVGTATVAVGLAANAAVVAPVLANGGYDTWVHVPANAAVTLGADQLNPSVQPLPPIAQVNIWVATAGELQVI